MVKGVVKEKSKLISSLEVSKYIRKVSFCIYHYNFDGVIIALSQREVKEGVS